MPNYYWPEVVATVVYIMSRTPTTIVHGVTPKENFIRKKLDLAHLKVCGCIAYVHIPDEKRTKLDPKPKNCIFIS